MIRTVHVADHVWEGIAFLLLVIILFNTVTDFAVKLGLIAPMMTAAQIQGFGVMAAGLALVNVLSRKFFGIVTID